MLFFFSLEIKFRFIALVLLIDLFSKDFCLGIGFIILFFLFDSFKLLLESLFNPNGLSFSKKFILVKGFMGLSSLC